jgi:hypothetical protein
MNLSKTSLFTLLTAILYSAVVFCFLNTKPTEAVAHNAAAPPSVSVVASDLHNPRGLNFGPTGQLFVAEAAGIGTPSSNCGVMSDGSTKCSANTASITRIDLRTGDVERIISGLPSLIFPDGTADGGTGVHDVSFQGMGNAFVTVGLGLDPTLRTDHFGAAGSNYARLGRFNPSGKFRLYEDLGAYEATVNPDGGLLDTNPYGVLALPGKVVYTDAGGNSLNQVTANGTISTLAAFARVARPGPGPTSVQAVPTSVDLGPDCNYYVGVLTGGPFTVGIASVYRVPPTGGTPVPVYTGFTNIIDVTFGPDGSLYVLEIAQNAIPNFGAGGRLVRIAPDGTRTTILAGPPLIAPGGVAVGDDGALYVTNLSISATAGQVLRIVP